MKQFLMIFDYTHKSMPFLVIREASSRRRGVCLQKPTVRHYVERV